MNKILLIILIIIIIVAIVAISLLVLNESYENNSFYFKLNSPLYKNDPLSKHKIKKYNEIYTIGCFDNFHWGHERLLYFLQKHCNHLIIGIHNNDSISKIKNLDIQSIQPLEDRVKNIRVFTDNIVIITKTDPTSEMKKYIEDRYGNIKPIKNCCFIRGGDNKKFPSIELINSIMDIYYLPYYPNISATYIRNNDKISTYNKLLRDVVHALEEYNIDYHLDCGTLLGAIREGTIMAHDTDIDVSVHLSKINELKQIDLSKYNLEKTMNRRDHNGCGYILSVKHTGVQEEYCDIYLQPAFPKLTKIFLLGKIYNIPKNPELYISMLYGNWTKKSGKHADWRYHRKNGLANSKYFKKYADPKYQIIDCYKK